MQEFSTLLFLHAAVRYEYYIDLDISVMYEEVLDEPISKFANEFCCHHLREEIARSEQTGCASSCADHAARAAVTGTEKLNALIHSGGISWGHPDFVMVSSRNPSECCAS